jgi:hypothetical protein
MKPAAFFALACACLAFAGPAQAAIGVGVADDTLLGNPDGGAAFLGVMNDIGLRELRIPVRWDSRRPTMVESGTQMRTLLPAATVRGVRVAFSFQPRNADALTSSPQAPSQFIAFMQRVARSFPTVRDVIVGNEPNQPRFWQPQYDAAGRNVSAGAYEALLAESYDALKEVDPELNVIGLGLSSRGNDDPGASGNISTSPVRFVEELGAAYRASGRMRPLMDELAYHPYPKRDTDSLTEGFPWPNAGVTNLGRIKQAFWDAFHGTGQRTFEDGLRMRLDEVGWQVAVPGAARLAYFGAETVKPTTEAQQAAIYASLVRYAACDRSVDALLFFGLRDEANLARWQAGLLRADGSPRPSFGAVKAALTKTGGNCVGRMRPWRQATTVDGTSATFPRARRLPRRLKSWSFLASADEEASFDAGVYRLRHGHRAIRVRSERGRLNAHVARNVRFPARRLASGKYVYSIRFRAAANPSRTSRRTSRPFVVYGRR